MATQAELKSLCFVSWNTNGIKNNKKSPQKLFNLLSSLHYLQADVVFLQETHVGPERYQILEQVKNWKVYFTVYSSRSRGVAILIRDTVEFEYICHDEDCSGGYIVLFCHLYGELYTLVNVYNHKADRNVLGRLKEYLAETAEGVLVVGGDFNTGISELRDIVKDFTEFLNFKDVWLCLRPEDQGFTRRQNESFSRTEMFFLREEIIGQVTKIEVNNRAEIQNISDHYPLVLELSFQKQIKRKYPKVSRMIKNRNEHNSDRRPGKISGAEILSAILTSLDKVEHMPDTEDVSYYKTNRCPLTETLKREYNDILMNRWVPENFKYLDDRHNFSVKYLIFSEILAKRLNAFFSGEGKCDRGLIVMFERSPQNIRWSFLKRIFNRLNNYYTKKLASQAPFVPPLDLDILDYLLPKTQSSSSSLRNLELGCPLTNAILNSALAQLDLKVRCQTECTTTVSFHHQTLNIYVHESKRQQVIELVEKFQKYSGLRLSFLSDY